MSSPEIEKMIEEKIAASGNSNLMSDFVRIKKGKVVKGESKRLKYCAFLKERLPAVWKNLSKSTNATNKPTSLPVPPVIKQLLANVNILPSEGENFEMMIDPNEPKDWANMENEQPQENIYNVGSNQPAERIFVPYPRESRAKIPDPSGGKLSKRLLKQIEIKLRRMKKQGVKLPNFKNQSEMYKFVMTQAPQKRKMEPLPSKPVVAPKRMKFGNGNARVPTRTLGGIALASGTRLTASESRQAIRQAENVSNKLTKNMTPESMRKLLISRYAPEKNTLMKNLENKKNYNNVLNVIKRFEIERARVLKNLSETNEPSTSPGKPSSSFTFIRGGPSMTNIVRRARAKPAANRTPAEKRALRFMEASARMKGARSKAPGAIMKVTNRPILMNNSNNNTPPLEPSKSPVSSLESENNNVPNVVKNIDNGKLNINKMNKPDLIKVAKNVYRVAKPGENIPFEKANVEKIRKLIKVGVKKIMKGKI